MSFSNTLTAKNNSPFKNQGPDKSNYLPQFFYLSDPIDEQKLEELLHGDPDIVICDELQTQLEDLVKSLNPQKLLSKDQLTQLAWEHLGNIPAYKYGVWVYYPWLKKIVHLLDKEEFIHVRTSRNMYKITPQERDILSGKKIGVVGLSVGQAVSITMAMERCFGEIRLADFDSLELTNLNRMRTGVHNLGLSKVIIAAREIAEIDPFLKVICFNEGLTEKNMDQYFLEGGKLDLLIEECDSLDIKILSRLKAKELSIPVVMDTSDRGMLDVERFDLEPNRSILHGLIDHLDISKLKTLKTNEEKIPYILPMVGLSTCSTRLKASVLEVGQSITTWPQLATTVALGGAITGDVCRRIMLGHYHESGRYFVDIEQLVANKNTPAEKELITPAAEPLLKMEMMQIISLYVQNNQNSINIIDAELITEIVKAATLAPSGGNCQPWKWIYNSGHLFLFYDQSLSGVLLDFEDTASFIALGAASENVILKGHSLGMEVLFSKFPIMNERKLIAVFDFYDDNRVSAKQNEPHVVDSLVDFIPLRFTNRKISKRASIDPSILIELQNTASTIPGANLTFLSSDKDLLALGSIISRAEKLRLMDKRGHRDFVSEIRWTKEENEKTKDGIDIETLALSLGQMSGLLIAKEWKVINYLNKWGAGNFFERPAQNSIAGASAIGLITMPEYNNINFVEGGRAVQRVWLAANQKSISFQPQSPVLFLFSRLFKGKGEGLSDIMKKELQELRQQFLKLFPMAENQSEIFLFRLCVANPVPVKSLRKPVEEVFEIVP